MAEQQRIGGYNKRSRSEHPRVRIIKLPDGRVVLRFRDPGTGKLLQVTPTDRGGLPVTSRERAKPFARDKANELAREHMRINEGGRPMDVSAGWADLFKRHGEHLTAKNRSPKTIRACAQHWKYLENWRGRPAKPHLLTIAHLEDFVCHLRTYRTKGKRPLALHSVAAAARHVKALLNYGRRYLSCVKLDGESINAGLSVGSLPKPMPVALSPNDLDEILTAALKQDGACVPAQHVFPFLAFVMVTGCRRGEAEKLRWRPSKPGAQESYCDFDGGRIVIWGNKTGRGRAVPLNVRPKLTAMLRALEARTNVEAEPFVFGGPLPLAIGDRRQAVAPSDVIGRSLKALLERVRDASSIDYALKDFRSTLATHMANSGLGLNLYTLAGELGHDYAVLVKHYAGYMTLPQERAKAATVEELLGIDELFDTWLSGKRRQATPQLRLVS